MTACFIQIYNHRVYAIKVYCVRDITTISCISTLPLPLIFYRSMQSTNSNNVKTMAAYNLYECGMQALVKQAPFEWCCIYMTCLSGFVHVQLWINMKVQGGSGPVHVRVVCTPYAYNFFKFQGNVMHNLKKKMRIDRIHAIHCYKSNIC